MNEQTIFTYAIERDSSQRPAFLDSACGSDFALRRRVERLLELHDCAGSFLVHPVAGVGDTVGVPMQERPGTRIGPYHLLEQIGEGGMGVVYLAEQKEPVRRKVALKVIKPGMDTRQVVTRFEAERQALAMMNHSSIAKVLDAGATEAGRPYFVMELVKGLPITEFCDQHQLSTDQRLELFITVCQAVQHAHQKGLIHRDLKPSNVLVEMHDVVAVPKVIDFGVAKAIGHSLTEKTLHTAFSQMVGTPLYMSPEQAGQSSIDVDTRSDIYSLGVLLYEILTGSTPFDRDTLEKAGFDEMRRMIREVDPPRPSARVSTLQAQALSTVSDRRQMEPRKLRLQLRGELDLIVMKALEKDRTLRYETANGFAADVQRYLDDEPVQACPPSASYRFLKVARRHKWALTTSAVVGVMLLASVGVIAGSLGWVARDRAVRHAKIAGQVQLILDEVVRRQQEQRWPEALAAARRVEALTIAGEATAELEQQVQEHMIDLQMVQRLEDIRLKRSQLMEDRRGYEHEWADLAYRAAFREYGIDVEALPAEVTAMRIRSHSGVGIALTAAIDDWSDCLALRGDSRSAAILADAAQEADPDPWRRQVRMAWRREEWTTLEALAASEEVVRLPSQTLVLIAKGLNTGGRADLGLEILRRGQVEQPGDFWINFQLAYAYAGTDPPRWDETIRFYSVALGLRPEVAAAHNNLGAALSEVGRVGEAMAAFHKAIALDPEYAQAHTNLGNALFKKKLLAESIAAHERAIALNPEYALAHTNLGVVLWKAGRMAEAIASIERAITLDSKLAMAHENLGLVLHDNGLPTEAIASIERSIVLNPESARVHTHLGNALRAAGRIDEAIAAHERAIALDSGFAPAHYNLGIVLSDAGRVAEAIAAYRRAIALDPEYAEAHSNLGKELSATGRVAEAIAAYRRAIALDPGCAPAHINLGNVLQAEGHVAEAIAAYRQIITLGSDDLPEQKLELAQNCSKLACLLRDNREPMEAKRFYRQAIALREPLPLDAAAEIVMALAHDYHGLATLLNTPDSEACLQREAELMEALVEAPDETADSRIRIGHSYRKMGEAAARLHKLNAAESAYRWALSVFERAAVDFPSNPYLRQEQAFSLRMLGDILERAHRLPDAHTSYHRSAEIYRELASETIDPRFLRGEEAIVCADLVRTSRRLEHPGIGELADRVLMGCPDLPWAQNKLVWALVSYADLAPSHFERAMLLMKKAVEEEPGNGFYWNTLGVAHYRAREWAAAIAALEESMRLLSAKEDSARFESQNTFFLAMASHQHGRHFEATAWYDKAVAWMDKYQSGDEELRRFRAAAATLLGRADPVPTAKSHSVSTEKRADRMTRSPIGADHPVRNR